jgi:RNA polymerase sigma-70 factor (ECF subfamily)
VTTIPGATTQTPETIPDQELVRRSLAGQRAAFSVLVQRHRTAVATLALRALGNNADDAQDVAQDSFVYAYLRLGELREPARFGPWLRTLTLSLCADFRRRKATRALPGQTPLFDATESIAAERDLAQSLILREALQALPEAQRLSFSLFHAGGYSHAEIAALLSVPVNTVRSRLQAAKRALRATLTDSICDLSPSEEPMPATTKNSERTSTTAAAALLPPTYLALVRSTFSEARIVSAERSPETWMPFAWRLASPCRRRRAQRGHPFVRLALHFYQGSQPDGTKEAALYATVKRLGLPVPDLLAGPIPDVENENGLVALTGTPTGRNLLLWALEGNIPHRIRAATALTIESIDRLHALTDPLQADPVGRDLPRRPLSLDLSEIAERGGPWMADRLFADAVKRLTPLVEKISATTPLVYTNDLYFPNFLRFGGEGEAGSFDAPFGWPGDPRSTSDRHITEYVMPFGWFGDPILGLAKFWTYDCYPFVHTGLVERYLYEKGISRQQFAPRLAVRALWTLQREAPVQRPAAEAPNTGTAWSACSATLWTVWDENRSSPAPASAARGLMGSALLNRLPRSAGGTSGSAVSPLRRVAGRFRGTRRPVRCRVSDDDRFALVAALARGDLQRNRAQKRHAQLFGRLLPAAMAEDVVCVAGVGATK